MLGEIGAAASTANFDHVIRRKTGLGGLGQFFPAGNPLRVNPHANFGGIPNATKVSYDDRLPIDAGDERYIVLDNLSYAKGKHSMKFGFYFERNFASEGPRSPFGGSFAFDADPNNPVDSGNAYANAALGLFRTYSEGGNRTAACNIIDRFEWFAQDLWKVSRRFTLDAGIRVRPLRSRQGPASQSIRIERRRTAGRARSPYRRVRTRGVNRRAYVRGAGDTTNGLVTAKEDRYKNGFTKQQPIDPSQRLTFCGASSPRCK